MAGTWQRYEMGEDGFVEESINPARILAVGREGLQGARGKAPGAHGRRLGVRGKDAWRARDGAAGRAQVWRRRARRWGEAEEAAVQQIRKGRERNDG